MTRFKTHHPEHSAKKIEQLAAELNTLQKKINEHEEALILASKTIKKASDALNEVAIIQATHLEHTAKLHSEVQAVVEVLFPKDNIKYDLMNEPYN